MRGMSSQWKLFYGMMAYGALVSLLVPFLSAALTGVALPAGFYVAALALGLVLTGFVTYVIVKVTLRHFLVRFLEKFNPLVEQPLPKPANPLVSTELDNLDTLFSTLTQRLASYIASAVSQQMVLQRLQRYFSPAVAAQLASAQENLDQTAEMSVTVLFADIRDFTRMSAHLDPKSVVEILNDFFTEMIDLVQEGGGTVLKLIGDEVMAVFGAPLPLAGDAERAVAVARRMHQAFAQLQEKWRAHGLKHEVGLGIGLNRGRVVVGNVGAPSHLDYTVIGDTVNLASRLTQAEVARPGETIVSHSVASALAGRALHLERRTPVLVKGKDEPQENFCVR